MSVQSKKLYDSFSHLIITSSTGTYLSTNNGFGAGYHLVDGTAIFCRPDRFKDQPSFKERLGSIKSIRVITQEERMLLSFVQRLNL